MISDQCIEEFLGHLRISSRAEETIRKHKHILRTFSAVNTGLGTEEVTLNDILDFLNQNGKARATLINRHGVLKNYFKWLQSTGRILINPMDRIDPPKREKRLPSRIMTTFEVNKVLSIFPNRPGVTPTDQLAFRNRVILELMYSSSLRRSEVSALNIKDFDPLSKSLRVAAGKTKTGRLVPVGRHATSLVITYLNNVRPKVADEALFISRRGSRLGCTMISAIARRAIKKAGIKTKATSHSFRKSSATHMLRNKASLFAVQAMLGHKKITTTESYTKVYPRDLIRILKGHHPREKQKNLKMERLRVPKFLFKKKIFLS